MEKQPPATGRLVFVSDLHLFCRRSSGHGTWEALCQASAAVEACVLGGDIFDFRWARHASLPEAVEDACQHVAELTSSAPDCQFHFILGNHDCHELFVPRLAELAESTANLAWHPHFLRLGDSLFLHGDVADRKMNTAALDKARGSWRRGGKGLAVLDRLYDVAVLARMHTLVYRLAYPNRTVARRLLHYLEHIEHGPETGVRNVYFGHTHRPVDGVTFSGVRFFNCGAALPGVQFQRLEISSGTGADDV